MNTKMQTKKEKRGFTITELVIVIAVIAILAAVLIPTFSNVINRANESAAMQEARSEWSNFQPEVAERTAADNDFIIVYQNGDNAAELFEVVDGQFQTTPLATTVATWASETVTLVPGGKYGGKEATSIDTALPGIQYAIENDDHIKGIYLIADPVEEP